MSLQTLSEIRSFSGSTLAVGGEEGRGGGIEYSRLHISHIMIQRRKPGTVYWFEISPVPHAVQMCMIKKERSCLC